MIELIKIVETEIGRVSSARDLHKVLSVKTEFSKWCKRMFEYGFIENQDYTLVKIGEGNAHNKTDYAITIDTAKEISMLQRTDKGKEVRQYYISVEKNNSAIIIPSYQIENPAERARAWALEFEEKQLLIESNSRLQYRSDFVDICFDTDGVFRFDEVAKILKLDFGSITLYDKMREYGLIMKGTTTPYQKYVNNGYFKVVEQLIENGKFKKLIATTFATQKGIGHIKKLLDKNKK
jgi:anti-repressor protein